jgi:hypothetical protein
MKLYIIQRARFERRMNQCRSYPWKSLGLAVEKETDLKGMNVNAKCMNVNVKCMNVILHGLRPVPINR